MTATVADKTATTVPEEARKELYEIFRNEDSFEQNARDALELGRQYLNADNGYLTRIDQETDHWEAIASADSSEGPLPTGLELDLETTYCRQTVDAGSNYTIYDAPNQERADSIHFETRSSLSSGNRDDLSDSIPLLRDVSRPAF
ncbi:MAG: hypothetical protein U5K28_02175 [Halobacteriales archaeon]|nr:hypothetical protein [Halobacteriales archaeon]